MHILYFSLTTSTNQQLNNTATLLPKLLPSLLHGHKIEAVTINNSIVSIPVKWYHNNTTTTTIHIHKIVPPFVIVSELSDEQPLSITISPETVQFQLFQNNNHQQQNTLTVPSSQPILDICHILGNNSLYSVVEFLCNNAWTGGGILLYGPAGVGKTYLMNAFIQSSKRKVKYLSTLQSIQDILQLLPPLTCYSQDYNNMETETPNNQIWILPDSRKLSLKQQQQHEQKTNSTNVTPTNNNISFNLILLRTIERARRLFPHLVVFCESRLSSSIDELWTRPGLLDCKIEISVPNFQQRQVIFEQFLSSTSTTTNQNTTTTSDPDIGSNLILSATKQSAGFSRADIHMACSQMMINNSITNFNYILRTIRTNKHQGCFNPYSNNNKEEESTNTKTILGGLVRQRQLLYRVMIQPLEQSLPISSGILFYGPSGCGKTFLAMHLGRELVSRGLCNFESVQCVDLVSKIVGETERNVREMFERARESGPTVLFLDHIETLAPRRTSEREKTFDRVLSTLLVEIDGISKSSTTSSQRVTVMAATSDPNSLDPALIRRGRLGLKIHIPFPQDDEERAAVMMAASWGMPIIVQQTVINHDSELIISHNGDEAILERSQFFRNICILYHNQIQSMSRAELATLCRDAAMFALRENINCLAITQQHFRYVIPELFISEQADDVINDELL
jgi:SpoVK/Ycf46/Vps4 family AAA+-type ATPase